MTEKRMETGSVPGPRPGVLGSLESRSRGRLAMSCLHQASPYSKKVATSKFFATRLTMLYTWLAAPLRPAGSLTGMRGLSNT